MPRLISSVLVSSLLWAATAAASPPGTDPADQPATDGNSPGPVAPAAPGVAPTPALAVRPVVDAAITVGALLLYTASNTLLKDALSPDTCQWCEPPRVDRSLRDRLVWSDTDDAHQASNVAAFVAVPVASFGLLALASWRDDDGGDSRRWLVDGLIVAEAAALGAVLTQTVKFAVGRERPHIHALPEADKPLVDRPTESNLSFYSGHTSLAFSFATAAGTVASQRKYRWAPVVWAVGLPLAASAGYFRIGADKHWASDVVVGAVVGSAVGIAVPRLLHPRQPGEPGADLRVVPTGNGVAVLGSF